MERVKWFVTRAEYERNREEIMLLHEEFQRSIRGFKKLHEVWTQLANDPMTSPGKRAFAAERADLFERFCAYTAEVYSPYEKDAPQVTFLGVSQETQLR